MLLQNLIYREDFNRERNDRAQIYSTLTDKLEKAEVEMKELKKQLQDLEHEKTHLNEVCDINWYNKTGN